MRTIALLAALAKPNANTAQFLSAMVCTSSMPQSARIVATALKFVPMALLAKPDFPTAKG
jgi:hypothetical protein